MFDSIESDLIVTRCMVTATDMSSQKGTCPCPSTKADSTAALTLVEVRRFRDLLDSLLAKLFGDGHDVLWMILFAVKGVIRYGDGCRGKGSVETTRASDDGGGCGCKSGVG